MPHCSLPLWGHRRRSLCQTYRATSKKLSVVRRLPSELLSDECQKEMLLAGSSCKSVSQRNWQLFCEAKLVAALEPSIMLQGLANSQRAGLIESS